MEKHILCTSPNTDSLNYSLFALQLGGFGVCFGFGLPPFFLPCKLASYLPAVKIASGIHHMQVFSLKSSWSPVCTESTSRRQGLFWQMASLSVVQLSISEVVPMNRGPHEAVSEGNGPNMDHSAGIQKKSKSIPIPTPCSVKICSCKSISGTETSTTCQLHGIGKHWKAENGVSCFGGRIQVLPFLFFFLKDKTMRRLTLNQSQYFISYRETFHFLATKAWMY